MFSGEQPLQVARCTKIINADTDDPKYIINVKQFAKFVVDLSDQVAPTDIEEGMRVGFVAVFVQFWIFHRWKSCELCEWLAVMFYEIGWVSLVCWFIKYCNTYKEGIKKQILKKGTKELWSVVSSCVCLWIACPSNDRVFMCLVLTETNIRFIFLFHRRSTQLWPWCR